MTKKEEKEELSRLQKQFQRDLARLKEEYGNKELARKIGKNAGNLSRYATDPPGIKVLKDFYLALNGEIENPFEKTSLIMKNESTNKEENANQDSQESKDQKENKDPQENKDPKEYNQEEKQPEVEHGPVPYPNWDDAKILRNELISLHKEQNEFLRTEFSKMNSTNQNMSQSQLILSRENEFYRKQTYTGNDNPSA